jgi:hypothetical protein
VKTIFNIKTKRIIYIFGIVIFMGIIASLQLAKAWTEPSGTPPGANVGAPITAGAAGQTKIGGLILNTGGATNGLIVQSGNMGIGTTTPAQKLDVNGNVVATDVCTTGGKCLSAASTGSYNQGSCYTADGGCSYGSWAYCASGYFVAGMYMSGCDVYNMWWGHRFILYCCK